MLIAQLEDPCKWDELVPLVQQQLNTSVSKTTRSTPFELLHDYKPRFHDGILKDLSTTSGEWSTPEELREAARANIFHAQGKMKDAYDLRLHGNIKFVPGEVVVMTRSPKHTGDSVKLRERYRGPLAVEEALPGDVYRVVEFAPSDAHQFATTAHVAQLKSWGREEKTMRKKVATGKR